MGGADWSMRLFCATCLVVAAGLVAHVSCDLATARGSSAPCGLRGRVRFVDAPGIADYRVRWVDGPADFGVMFVDRAPSRPGEWREVQEIADFTVYVTDGIADFTAREVWTSGGCQ